MKNTAIIYVHGALSSEQSWNYIRLKLSSLVNANEHFLQYDLSKQLSTDIAVDLAEQIVKLVEETPVKKLILVGHSFGGVLSVAAIHHLKDYLDSQQVEYRVISLATPFGGSEIAATLRIFKPTSKFLSNVSSSSALLKFIKANPLPCEVCSFITTAGSAEWSSQPNDGVVTLESQTFFRHDPNCTFKIIEVNHFEILLSDEVVKEIYTNA